MVSQLVLPMFDDLIKSCNVDQPNSNTDTQKTYHLFPVNRTNRFNIQDSRTTLRLWSDKSREYEQIMWTGANLAAQLAHPRWSVLCWPINPRFPVPVCFVIDPRPCAQLANSCKSLNEPNQMGPFRLEIKRWLFQSRDRIRRRIQLILDQAYRQHKTRFN